MSLTNATFKADISASAPYAFTGSTVPAKRSQSVQWTSGTTPPNQADTTYVASLSVTSGSPLSIDLSGGTIKQPDGTTATFAKVDGIYICNTLTSGSGVLTAGGGTNSVITAFPPLKPGDFVQYASASNGIVVTNSTADLLIFSASTGTITFDLILIGRSA